MDEFSIIKKFFTSPVQRADVVVGSGDDCAVVAVPADKQLAITTDTLVNGVHFPISTTPFDIGYKALAVNLSDLAAMGATPAWVTATLTMPNAAQDFLADFARGFYTLAQQYNVQLIGGDLTHGPLSITVQALGFLPSGKRLLQAGAQVGDLIYVTGTLGDAGLALQHLLHQAPVAQDYQAAILQRLNQPQPRVAIGEKILAFAHSAIDLSDGLAGDLRHILTASRVGANINVDNLPLSPALQASVSRDQAIRLALTAGDDYELCFTVAPGDRDLLTESIFTCIGEITTGTDCLFHYQDGTLYHDQLDGFKHF